MNFFLIISLICFSSITTVEAKRISFSTRSYTKKAPYAGMGKRSCNNGLIKAKGISGHGRRTKKGYTYVNPYARSK